MAASPPLFHMNAFDRSVIRQRERLFPILMLTLLWLVTRGILFACYEPVTYPDSGAYQRLAHQIITLDFRGYDGQRTPGYPLLLALVAANNFAIWLVQSVLALMTALLVYTLLRRAGTSTSWAMLAAVINLLTLNTLFFEPAIMTETVTGFLLVAVSYLIASLVTGKARSANPWLVGLMTALLILTRSQYIVLIPVFLVLLWWFVRERRGTTLLIFLLVASAPVLGWAGFNKYQTGYFTITTLLGYNLSNHSGAFMERAPDKDAVLRDTYLKHRDREIAETGAHHMTIFDARQDLLRTTGLSEIGLSREFQRISINLFIAYPADYLRSVGKAWLSYWTEPNYWRLDKVRSPGVSTVVQSLWKVQHLLLRGLNAVFILLTPYVVWRSLTRRDAVSHSMRVALVLAANVVSVSVMQALVEFGENGRYFIPNQPLVLMVVLLVFTKSTVQTSRVKNDVYQAN